MEGRVALTTLTFLECGQAVVSLNVRICGVQGNTDWDDVLVEKESKWEGEQRCQRCGRNVWS